MPYQLLVALRQSGGKRCALLLLVIFALVLTGCSADQGITAGTPIIGDAQTAAPSVRTWGDFVDFFEHLLIDLIAIWVTAYRLYFKRHGRRDLLMVYTAFNLGLFVVVTVISLMGTTLGVGFGLFAILSLIRLRSEPFSNIELGYFFMSMTLAVVNALNVGGTVLNPMNQLFTIMLNAVIVLTIYVTDHRYLRKGYGHQLLVLDAVYDDERDLRQALERRLRAELSSYTVIEVDYVREITRVDVRYIREDTPHAAAPGSTPIPTTLNRHSSQDLHLQKGEKDAS